MAPLELESNLQRAAENEKNTDINTVYGSNPRSRDGDTHQELLEKLYSSSHYHVKNSHPARIDGTYRIFQLLEDNSDRVRTSIRRLWRILALAASKNTASQILLRRSPHDP
ncbi:hypothetical protein NW754_010760 [Fusarium falciforme]|nr:hypothetical protein NW754_010760 [Fusarium falciforme]